MSKPKRRIMRRFKLDEISLVDQPAQEPARMTLLKRQVTKSIGGKNFFAKDFAYVEDETDPTTWKWRLTDRPGGKPTPARVMSVIKAFEGQRYAIPDDALDSILDKLREAWMKAFPSKAGEMPSALNDDQNPPPNNDKQEDDEQPPMDGAEGSDDEDNNEPDPNANSEDEENEDEMKARASKAEDDADMDSEDDTEKEEDEDEADMVDKILKGYIDTSAGAKTFAEVFEIFRQQDEHYEMLDKAWPVISALDQSIRSIVADTEIDTATKHTMLRNSVETFLAAIKSVMPEVEEVLEKVLTKSVQLSKGAKKMAKSNEPIEKRLEALEKKLNDAEKAREAAEAKAARLEKIAALTADEKEFFDRLPEKEQDNFLKMNKVERVKVIKKALEEDETIEFGGQTFSKSQVDPAIWSFMKAQAAQQEELKKQLQAEREARENAEIAKQAREELANLPGTEDEKVALLKSIRALPQEQQEVMLKFAKQANSVAALAIQRLGTTGVRSGEGLLSKAAGDNEFMQKVAEIRKRDNCSRTEAMRKARKEYPEIYKRWNGASNGAVH